MSRPRLSLRRFGLLALLSVSLAAAAAEESAEALLARARRPAGGSSFARLEGIVQHRPDGGAMQSWPIYLGAWIDRGLSRAQLLIDNREGYLIEQIRAADGKATTRVSPLRPEGYAAPLIRKIGLQPADLTTGFLAYDLVREAGKTLISGIPCRVLILRGPDGRETVRVSLAARYAFPLRAEFFNTPDGLDGKPSRTLETASFKQQNGVYYAELLNLYGPTWRSRVHFTRAELGIPDPGNPPQWQRPVAAP